MTLSTHAAIVALALGSLTTSPALAQSTKPKAPAVEGARWADGRGAVQWSSLDGHLVLVHRFATWCWPGFGALDRLGEYQEQYGPTGLRIIGVSDEPRSRVNEFAVRRELAFPIAGDVRDVYRHDELPFAWLISPSGKIVWEGHPAALDEASLRRHLRDVRFVPPVELPPTLRSVRSDLDRQRFGAAVRSLEQLATDQAHDDSEPARKALATLLRAAEKRQAAIEKTLRRGFPAYAIALAEMLEKDFAGTSVAKDANARIRDWKRDPEVKAALEAQKLLARARDLMRQKKLTAAKVILQGIVVHDKYDGTRAKASATRDLELLDEQLGKGQTTPRGPSRR